MQSFQFHPAVARWFEQTFGSPTEPQMRGWPAIQSGRHALISAPTGSGKTLAAFLTALDDLLRESLTQPLPDEVRVVYVSPLKALSADIHKNLAEPRRGIRRIAEADGIEAPRISYVVRQGGIYHEILEEATAIKADLIVMTSHRPHRHAVRTYFLGSNAGHVVRYAKCSVLVVRH